MPPRWGSPAALRRGIPSHLIPFHLISSHPIPSHPIPSHLIPSRPISSQFSLKPGVDYRIRPARSAGAGGFFSARGRLGGLWRWHPCRGAGPLGNAIRWCRFAQPPATRWDASGIIPGCLLVHMLGCLRHRRPTRLAATLWGLLTAPRAHPLGESLPLAHAPTES